MYKRQIYIYTGGEPLMRKADLMRICQMHPDCVFLCVTNATLIDEAFADEMLRVKNFVPAISLEGDEAATDSRRGRGTYQKGIRAMELLHRKKLLYGISACYTSAKMCIRDSAHPALLQGQPRRWPRLGALFV